MLDEEIAALASLTRSELIDRWIAVTGSEPLATLSTDLLVRGIAHAMQEKQLGGLSPAEHKALIAIAQGKDHPSPAILKAGTRLYRDWRGVTQEVLVLDDRYSWRGKSYTSLSEVARAITGTRWSGPRFFGLEARER